PSRFVGKQFWRSTPDQQWSATLRAAAWARLHVLVGLVVEHVADEQHDRLLAFVFPPMLRGIGLRPDLAGLVHDRHAAIAGIFDDLTLRDVDDRRTVAMAVPRHDAAGRDRQFTEAKLPLLDIRGLAFEIDGSKRRIGYAFGGMRHHLARI